MFWRLTWAPHLLTFQTSFTMVATVFVTNPYTKDSRMRQPIAAKPCFALVFLVVISLLAGCTHQEVHNSPCATLNSTSQIKPSMELSMIFGNDAIQLALDQITGRLRQQASTSTADLAKSARDTAVRAAENSGKKPSAKDIADLDTYIRDQAIPAVRQNPSCNMAPLATPYFGIENIAVQSSRPPLISIKNWGPVEGQGQVLIRQFVDQVEHSRMDSRLMLGPGQTRMVFVPNVVLPTDDILSGKAKFFLSVDITYGDTPEGKRREFHEAYKYDHAGHMFYLVRPKVEKGLYIWPLD